ncbi:MAG: DegV family protein [Anaerolineaceae bacterium]
MRKVKIITDSSAYLPKAIAEQYDIRVVPLTLNWDGVSYFDGVDIQAEEFYTRLSTSKSIPTTSQVTIGQFMDFFEPLVKAGEDVIYLGISDGISATYNSAIQTAELLGNPPNLVIMKTQLVSMALSFMVIEAARAAEKGATLAEVNQVAEDALPRIGVFFTVDTLEYLHKGGRINSAKRLLGSAINLKPIMEIRNGKIELVESVISTKKATARMLDLIEKAIAGRTPVRLAPFHALAYDRMLAMEASAIERFHPVEVIRSEVSPVVGTHTGPGTLSMAYMVG